MPVQLETTADDPGLIRGIGRWALVAITLNSIVGSGIFGLPSRVHAIIGPFGLFAYVVCAAIVTLIALCFAEVSSRFTRTGGPYLYADRAFGAVVGFVVGWLMWVTRVSACAAVASIMASYAAFLWAPVGTVLGRALLITGVLGVLTWINLVGVREAAGAAILFTIAKLAPLILFVAAGVWFIKPHAFAGFAAPTLTMFSQTVLLLIFAFVGFETTTVAAGEARDPRRDIPFALFAGIAFATVLYLLVQAVCIGVLPNLANSERPLADAGVRIAGALGGALIALGAVISTTGTLHATVIMGPRVLYAMSVREHLPAVFGRTLARQHTPHVAILVTTLAALALALSGTFVYLATLSVIARITSFVATAIALLVFRRRGDAPAAGFWLRAAGLIVTLTCAACAWLVTTSAARELRDVAIATGAGLVLYAGNDLGRRVRNRVAR